MQPTLAGYLTFLRDIVQIPASVLPDNSPYINYSYGMAIALCYEGLQCVSPFLYEQAVYNLGTATLLYIAQDNDALPPPDNEFFSNLQKVYSINTFVAGVISASNDDTTGQSMTVPDFFKNITLGDLALLKTPWGREYLAIVQNWGTLWGLS